MSIIRQSSARPASVASASSQRFDDAHQPSRPQAYLPAAGNKAPVPEFYSVKPYVESPPECPPPPSNEPRITYLRRSSRSRSAPPSAGTVADTSVAAPDPVQPAAPPAVSHDDAQAEASDGEPVDEARHADPKTRSLSKATADQRGGPTTANGDGKPEKAPRPTVHQFSRSFARQHGIKAALLAGYLAHRIAATHKRAGEGYRCSLDELTSLYPYMRRSAVAGALNKLVKAKVLTVHHHNRRACDHTNHYAFAGPALQRAAQVDPVYFSIDDAVQHDLPAALLLTNLRMRITDERSRQRLGTTYRVCARELTKHLPLTRSTISRALQQLADAGLVKLNRRPGFDRALEVEVASVLPAGANPDSCGAKPDSCDPKPDVHGAIPDVHDPIPDITRSLQVDIESDHSKPLLESINSYEGRPAPPFADRACSLSLPPDTQPMPASGAAGETAGLEGVTSNPDRVPALEQDGASVTEETSDPSPLPSHPELLPATLVTEPTTVPFQFNFDPDQPFKLLPQAPIPPKQPFPDTLEELQRSNDRFVQDVKGDWRSVDEAVVHKVRAVIDQHGVERVFRWLAIEDAEVLFRTVRKAVERCPCCRADLLQTGPHVGVDSYCVSQLIKACRQYLDANPDSFKEASCNKALEVLACNLGPYYHEHQAELEREGLGHLRNGQTVWAERCQSPDVNLETAEHLSAAEKTRVFHNAALSINRAGKWSNFGYWKFYGMITITKKGLKLVRRFFDGNPHWTPRALLNLLDACLDRKDMNRGAGGFLEDFAVVRGSHLTYFMHHLEEIIDQLDSRSSIPDVFFPCDWATTEAA